jgi:hypothetical protein
VKDARVIIVKNPKVGGGLFGQDVNVVMLGDVSIGESTIGLVRCPLFGGRSHGILLFGGNVGIVEKRRPSGEFSVIFGSVGYIYSLSYEHTTNLPCRTVQCLRPKKEEALDGRS